MATPRSLPDLISLKGKRALITGSGGGLGQVVAWRLGEGRGGFGVVEIGDGRVAATKKELGGFGVRVNCQRTEISRQEERDELWEKLTGGGSDILVNNAGIYPFKEFLDVDEAFYKNVIETNLDSVYWMCQKMISRRLKLGGVIVNVGSIEAVVAFKEDLAHYSVSKAGVIALTRALAKEHGKHGFRINAVVPGGIITSGTKRAAKGIFRFNLGLIKTGIEFKQRLPIGRLGRPDEVACMALVLASDMSSYVHGAAIPVDGGFLAV